MPAPFSILALDLHNTIYDEVMEYGLAIDEAIEHWLQIAQSRGKNICRETLHAQLSAAHRKLGSDWDADAWRHIPSLAALGLSSKEFKSALQKAETKRQAKSRERTLAGLYDDIVPTLKELKKRSISIYIVTEAAADIAMQTVDLLGLSGIVDGVYSYPSRTKPIAIAGTFHKPFAVRHGTHLKKPHPLLLAEVILDDAVKRNRLPDVTVDEVFGIRDTKLAVKDTKHAKGVKQSRDAMLYVGDSKFKDGMLARNAGCAFGHAIYGKKVHDAEGHAKSLAIMYAVTGWDQDTLKLTQDASRSTEVNSLMPDYTFETGLAEVLPLFT